MTEIFGVAYHWFLFGLYFILFIVFSKLDENLMMMRFKEIRSVAEPLPNRNITKVRTVGYAFLIVSIIYTLASVFNLILKDYQSFWINFGIGCSNIGIGFFLLIIVFFKAKKHTGDSPYRAETSLKELGKKNKVKLRKLGLK